MPDAAVLATILLVVGLFLVAVEMMIPSLGLIGAAAGLCLVISACSAWQAWWGTSPVFFWTYVAFFVVGIPGVCFGTIYLIQNTVFGTFVILRAQKPSADGPNPGMQTHLHGLIGQLGETVSTLTPGGMVEVAGERHHAESVGPMIESGQAITVVKTRGTRLVVCPRDEQQIDETASEPIPAETRIEPKQTDQLDFDIPENYTEK